MKNKNPTAVTKTWITACQHSAEKTI